MLPCTYLRALAVVCLLSCGGQELIAADAGSEATADNEGGTGASAGAIGSVGTTDSAGTVGFDGSSGPSEASVVEGGSGIVEGGSGIGEAGSGVSETGVIEASGPLDASALFSPACESCLMTACDSQYTACVSDPACVSVIECYDACVAGGGGKTSCALKCASSGTMMGGPESLALLECGRTHCRAPCFEFDAGAPSEGGG